MVCYYAVTTIVGLVNLTNQVAMVHLRIYIPYSGNLLREEIFANRAILLSEEIFAIFDFNLLGDF